MIALDTEVDDTTYVVAAGMAGLAGAVRVVNRQSPETVTVNATVLVTVGKMSAVILNLRLLTTLLLRGL